MAGGVGGEWLSFFFVFHQVRKQNESFFFHFSTFSPLSLSLSPSPRGTGKSSPFEIITFLPGHGRLVRIAQHEDVVPTPERVPVDRARDQEDFGVVAGGLAAG